MDNESTTDAPTAQIPLLDSMDPRIRDIYADDAFISIGSTNVAITFTVSPAGVTRPVPSVRVFISHSDFVGLMSVWEKRRDFLLSAYEGKPKSLLQMDQTKIEALFQEMVKVD